MIMKKYFLSLGLIVAAMFTLTNCTEQIDAPVEPAKVPFEIIASTAETKTTNNGMSTEWSADDAINLFHEVAGGAGYVDNGAFTITADNLGDKKFTGTIAGELDPDKVYNWYAIYPYSKYITTPANTSSGYTYIGHSNGLSQNGYNSMASLMGNVCPLYGVLKGNPAATTPAFNMNHLSSVIAINVTNANDAPLTITTASFTAPEDIVGSYYIDITKTPVVYTTNNVKKTAVVNVTGGTELEKNESAIIYAAIKPFTATTGQTLTLSVNGYSKDLVLTKNVTFSAGKIKTLNFAYDKVETPIPEGTTVVEVVAENLNLENEASVTSINDGLITFAKGTNTNNAPKYYVSGTAIRMYTGNTVTFTAPDDAVLTKIAFEFVSGYDTSLFCTNHTGYTDCVWQGEYDEVVFEVVGSNQARITKITLNYKEGEVAADELVTINVIDPKIDYYQGAEFEEPKVKAVYSNGGVSEVEGAIFSGYDMSVVGEQTVTVTYGGKSTSYIINVSALEGDKYVKYTEDLVEGDYIIVYDGVAMNTTVSSNRLQYSEVDILDNTIYSPSSDIIWHIAKSGDYWTIYNETANKYAASNGTKNQAQMLVSGTDDKSLWSVEGTYDFINKHNAANSINKTLRRNGTYGFACYGSSTGGALTLYKKQ